MIRRHPGRNGDRHYPGEKRSNETHASTTKPAVRLARKSNGQSAKLCHTGHVVMENRLGLLVVATHATGAAERAPAQEMIAPLAKTEGITLGGDKNDDTAAFVAEMRRLGVTSAWGAAQQWSPLGD